MTTRVEFGVRGRISLDTVRHDDEASAQEALAVQGSAYEVVTRTVMVTDWRAVDHWTVRRLPCGCGHIEDQHHYRYDHREGIAVRLRCLIADCPCKAYVGAVTA